MFKVKTTTPKTFKAGALVYNINCGGTFAVVAQKGNKVTLRDYYTGATYATPTHARVLKAFGPKALARITAAR